MQSIHRKSAVDFGNANICKKQLPGIFNDGNTNAYEHGNDRNC